MADKQRPSRRKKPKDTKSLTVREAYELHKIIGEKEKYLAFISGYARGYYDSSVGNKMRWGDEDVLATTAGSDLLATDNQSQVEPLESAHPKRKANT